uniref:Uncharacterized protein n=1 Tax=Rhizochromulina marina TaxID=1034831 RepID=A0A7S2STM1_9STRA|mmetsp:Transcript_757/g.2435  ORF Transcript_757/g.2435 Transcript_757/m.2435 type:complete len:136 (+) Transcript_757:126-533(+)
MAGHYPPEFHWEGTQHFQSQHQHLEQSEPPQLRGFALRFRRDLQGPPPLMADALAELEDDSLYCNSVVRARHLRAEYHRRHPICDTLLAKARRYPLFQRIPAHAASCVVARDYLKAIGALPKDPVHSQVTTQMLL